MKKSLLFFCFLTASLSFAQKADNSLFGHYEEKGDDGFYKTFKFDGNGKVLIADVDYGDYFTRNDSLIIYPDKDIFIFKLEKGKLIGKSTWVKNGKWFLKDNPELENKRYDASKADLQAQLLAEYYDISKNSNQLEALFSKSAQDKLSNLCDKGLAKACLDVFGIKMLTDTPGLLTKPESIATKKLKPNPELLALSKKIVALGNPEGHTVLGSYLYVLGLKKEADVEFDKAVEMGSTKAALAKFSIEMEAEANEKE